MYNPHKEPRGFSKRLELLFCERDEAPILLINPLILTTNDY